MGKNVRLFLIGFILLFATNAYCSPSNTISVPNSFTAQTTISSADTNANNNEIQSKYNAHTHSDITETGTITTGVWNGTAVSTQFGGTGNNWSAIASGGIIYFNGTGTLTTLAKGASGALLYFNSATLTPAWLSQGTSGQVLKSNGTSANPTWTTAGKVVQVVNTQTGAVVSGSTGITIADSIPTNSQGDEMMTLAITPTSDTNKLRIDVVVVCTNNGGQPNIAALFQDSTANALAASSSNQTSGEPSNIVFSYYMTAGTTSSTTFKVRAGSNAGTFYMNANGGTRMFGGVSASSITITEIAL